MTRKIVIPIFLAVLSLFSPVGDVSGMARTKPAGDTEREARIAYLKKHAIPVRSIDAEDVDFADLEPLRRVIGSRRVVMLGESTHGDGATFAAKIRLIRFLHERMGFDVLAFESGFYDTRKVWSALRAGGKPLKAVSSGVRRDLERQPPDRTAVGLYRPESKTDRPLELCGFDSQFTGSASDQYLLKDLGDYLSKIGLPAAAAGDEFRVTNALAVVLGNPNFLRKDSEFKKIGASRPAAILTAHQALGAALGSLASFRRTGDARAGLLDPVLEKRRRVPGTKLADQSGVAGQGRL